VEINGIAHTMLTVSDFDACAPFYRDLLTFFGLKPVIDGDGMLYCVGGRTAVGIVRAHEAVLGVHHLETLGSASTTCASAPASAATSTRSTTTSSSAAPRSCTRLRTAPGRRATTRCCSRIRTASASR